MVPALARAFVDGRDDWAALVLRPGHDLDHALRRAREARGDRVGLVLVVDQLEETVTQLTTEIGYTLAVAGAAFSAMQFSGTFARVIDVPGHTLGHIAFYFPQSGLAFTADSLMAGGCGRLFEGTARQMHASLQKLAALPPETLICSGHEYTTSNLRFAATVDPDNPALHARITDTAAKRGKGQPTVPSTLAIELATNPYLRAHLPSLKAAVGLPQADDATVFAEIRARKDKF